MARGGVLGKALERLEESTGQTVVSSERLQLLEQGYSDYRTLQREVEDIGWAVMDYVSGQPQEMTVTARRKIVQRARYVWANDPQAGAAVELMNDFCFGRGVPRPRAKDKAVQELIDEAWDDPDNQEVLTTLEAQLALGTDLALQSNLFLLMFDEGADGKVKLSILRHDDVTDIITDPERRHRSLWFVVGRPIRRKFNFKLGQWEFERQPFDVKPLYYKHWRNVDLVEEEKIDREVPLDSPEADQVGEGKVYHARINRHTEQKFGTPRFQRTLRWYTAYNEFVKARIDVAQATAAFIMKRKVRGTPNQLARDAAKLLSRRSQLAGGTSPEVAQAPPKPGSILEENDSVSHEALTLSSGSPQAQQDANIIRAPISASERFSQAYFGDASNSNLATATSLELPILKAVETRQEVVEGIFRWFLDRVVEKAVDEGRLSAELEPDEIEDYTVTPGDIRAALREACDDAFSHDEAVTDIARLRSAFFDPEYEGPEVWLVVSRTQEGQTLYRLVEAHEDKTQDEASTERDLGYEFSMPSPLRRMMADLVSSITQIAQTFDPNNTNPELSRALLTIALGEALEVQDPADLVDKIIPAGYQDPMLRMQMEAARLQNMMAANPEQFPVGPDGNPYGAPMNSTPPGEGSGPYQAAESEFVAADRRGKRIGLRLRRERPRQLEESLAEVDEPTRRAAQGRRDRASDEFGHDVVDAALDSLDQERMSPTTNGSRRR